MAFFSGFFNFKQCSNTISQHILKQINSNAIQFYGKIKWLTQMPDKYQMIMMSVYAPLKSFFFINGNIHKGK